MSFWVYGRHSVCEILKSGQPVVKLLIAKGTDKNSLSSVTDLAGQNNVECRWVPKEQLDNVAKGNHQGIAAEIDSFRMIEFKSFMEKLSDSVKNFVCLLDEIQDPQNLGAIIRSAACFGCSGAIIPKWRSAGMSESVMKSSSGAAAHFPLVQIANLTVAVERLKEKGYYIYGADPSGETIGSLEFDSPMAIVLGNEHRGIKPVLKKVCDRLISIPQTKTISSLNVSAAAAIFFYEISKRFLLK